MGPKSENVENVLVCAAISRERRAKGSRCERPGGCGGPARAIRLIDFNQNPHMKLTSGGGPPRAARPSASPSAL